MRPVLVDSSVLLDIVHGDPVWGSWSGTALAAASNEAVLVINPVIYAEVSVRFARQQDLDHVLPSALLRREPLPWEAAFAAGKAFVDYRRRGGARASILADFLIGAHALAAGYRLLTRDTKRFKASFPSLELIAPP